MCIGCADPAPVGVTYRDLDPAAGSTRGPLHIQRAPDESRVDAYQVSFAADETHKLAQIAKVPKTGSDLDVMIPSTKVPSGAVGIVVSAIVGGKESNHGVYVTPADNYPRRTEIHNDSAQSPFAFLDPASDELRIAATAAASMELPLLFMCNGTTCKSSTLAAPPQTGRTPSAVVDSGKLYFVATNAANANHLVLHACSPDGTDCAFADLSAGSGADSGLFPRVAVDGDRLLVVARTRTTPTLYTCTTSAAGCTGRDISGGAPGFDTADATSRPSVAFDGGFVTTAWQSATTVLLSRCKNDSTGCISADVGARTKLALRDPSVAIDGQGGTVLIAARNAGDANKATLVRCALDLATCTATEVSSDPDSGNMPSIAIDTVDRKVVMVTSRAGEATLFSCSLDGSNCATVPMKPSAHSFAPASLVIDGKAHLYAAFDEDAGKKLVLFDVGLF
jgi:hypothetical protein